MASDQYDSHEAGALSSDQWQPHINVVVTGSISGANTWSEEPAQTEIVAGSDNIATRKYIFASSNGTDMSGEDYFSHITSSMVLL